MSEKYLSEPESKREPSSPVEKKPYSQPVLTVFGDLRSMTLGNTGDYFESGPGGDFSRIPA